MKDYVFTHAKATSTHTKNEMNSIIDELTLRSQERSVGVVTRYKLDGRGSIPSAVGALCLGCEVDSSPPCCDVLWCLINRAHG
jgi:hypothetical protein